MPKPGINYEKVKKSNRNTILRLLNNMGPMSRKDIAVAIGLTPASVTMICSDLIEEGIITEIGEVKEKARVGRKKILVSLNSDYKYVVCVAIEAEETYISITDFMGKVIKTCTLVSETDIEPYEFIKMIASTIKSFMQELKLNNDRILGVGVSVPGKVDYINGISINTYSIWDKPVDIRKILEGELDIPVFVDNNVKAYSMSELLFGAGRLDGNLLVLKWGPGVGSSIIANNSIYMGANGMSAEVGHMIVRAKGKKCKCGRSGCLQTEIVTHALIENILNEYGDSEERHSQMPLFDKWLKSGHEITYKNTEEWCAIQDEKLQKVIDHAIEYLIYTAVNIAAVLDPNRIVVFGYLFDAPGLFERFKEGYMKVDLSRDDSFVVKSQLVQKKYHTEALSIVLKRMFY